jgi:methionyl-tRNA formyltransferase
LRLVFAGTPAFAVPSLERLHAAGHAILAVYTQPDRAAGRGRQLRASAVADAAARLQLPLHKPARLDAEAQAALKGLAPDLMVVVAYGLILPAAVLQIPRLGCVNVHASLLPRWRGAAPIARAIEAGDRETGVCIMQMDVGLDTGPVLARATHSIDDAISAGELTDLLAGLGADLLKTTLVDYAAGRLAPVQQPTEGVTYAHKLDKEAARIDWTRDATALAWQVRALNPAPVAWSELGGERIRIWRARAIDAAAAAPPGTIEAVGPAGIEVASGRQRLQITELQSPGGKVLGATAWSRGATFVGQRFS